MAKKTNCPEGNTINNSTINAGNFTQGTNSHIHIRTVPSQKTDAQEMQNSQDTKDTQKVQQKIIWVLKESGHIKKTNEDLPYQLKPAETCVFPWMGKNKTFLML